jgi:hypothetical protein
VAAVPCGLGGDVDPLLGAIRQRGQANPFEYPLLIASDLEDHIRRGSVQEMKAASDAIALEEEAPNATTR